MRAWVARCGAWQLSAAICIAVLSLGAVDCRAETALEPVNVLTLSGSQRVNLDGRLDESWWSDVSPIDTFYETDPRSQVAAPVRTEVRVAAGERRLYVAIRAFDPKLTALRAPIARRDDSADDVDKVTLYIDALGTRHHAQVFEVSASGSVGDGLFSEASGSADQEDAQFGVEDKSPNYRFRSAVARFDEGWTAELEIPFSSLRYEAGGARQWAILIGRNYPREEAYYMMSAPIPAEAICTLCYATPLTGVNAPATSLALQGAAALSYRNTQDRLGDSPAATQQSTQAGLDLKLQLRADTHADLTIRPDFSQIEIDAPQLSGNSRYAIYFPEKRQFFLEGADILESPLPVLRTRALAAPDWGVRVTHRGTVEGTALIVRDAATGDVLLPAATYTDQRARNQSSVALLARSLVHLDNATIGVLHSQRSYDDSFGRNAVSGIDAAWHPTSTDRFDIQGLWSRSTALQTERGVPETGGAQQVRWYHRGKALTVDATARRIDAGFRADNGFIERAGVKQSAWKLGVHQRPWWHSSEAGVYVSDKRDQDTDNGELVEATTVAGAYLMLPRLTKVTIEPWVQVRRRADSGQVLHTLHNQRLTVSSMPSKWWSGLEVEIQRGPMLDALRDRVGEGLSIASWAKWQLASNLQVQGEWKQLTIDDGGRRGFDETARRWLVLWHINSEHYLRLIDQRHRLRRDAITEARDVAHTLSWQLRLAGRWQLDAGLTKYFQSTLVPAETSRGHELFAKATFEFER